MPCFLPQIYTIFTDIRYPIFLSDIFYRYNFYRIFTEIRFGTVRLKSKNGLNLFAYSHSQHFTPKSRARSVKVKHLVVFRMQQGKRSFTNKVTKRLRINYCYFLPKENSVLKLPFSVLSSSSMSQTGIFTGHPSHSTVNMAVIRNGQCELVINGDLL